MKRFSAFYSIFVGFAPILRAPQVRSRREDHIPPLESGHSLVLATPCFPMPMTESRPERSPLPCNLRTARAPLLYGGFAPISRVALVRSRRKDHIPYFESGHRLVLMTSHSPVSPNENRFERTPLPYNLKTVGASSRFDIEVSNATRFTHARNRHPAPLLFRYLSLFPSNSLRLLQPRGHAKLDLGEEITIRLLKFAMVLF